ncbi:MAG: hypothetical protein LAT65_17920 [Saccharospirillum sp.]|nr:hypothetical protein [Saccharospirillum sp.]
MNERLTMIEWFASQMDARGIDFKQTEQMYDYDAPDNRACESLLREGERRFRVLFSRPVSPLEINEALYSACFYRHRQDRLLRQRSWWKRLSEWIKF